MTEGIYPALITPFTKDDKIDKKTLCDVIDVLISKGISGFYVGGSTGEALLMSLQERMDVLETAVGHVLGRVDVIAHIGCQHTQDSIQLAKHAQKAGAAAISSLPPIFYKYSLRELEQYYLDIAGAVDVPLILYNAPALTGVSFNAKNTANLFANSKVAGIKFTAHNLFEMQRVIVAFPGKTIINGHDELFLNTMVMGVRHAIGSTFNFMPEKFVQMQKLFKEGKLEEAYQVQNTVNTIVEGLMEVGVFRGVKGMMRLLGMPVGDCRKPFAPLDADELQKLEPLAKLCANLS